MHQSRPWPLALLVTTALVLVTLGTNLRGSTLGGHGGHAGLSCAVCHVGRGTQGDVRSVPAWNPTAVSSLDVYRSPTLQAQVSPPDGSSQLCLSCHDGTDAQVSPEHSFGVGSKMGSLAASHPVSFVYDSALAAQDGHLVDPSSLPPGVLDANGKMQCTSCHDVHGTSGNAHYLRWPYDDRQPSTTTQFCRQCHNM